MDKTTRANLHRASAALRNARNALNATGTMPNETERRAFILARVRHIIAMGAFVATGARAHSIDAAHMHAPDIGTLAAIALACVACGALALLIESRRARTLALAATAAALTACGGGECNYSADAPLICNADRSACWHECEDYQGAAQ